MKNEKGVTLIALIITIIVMLILVVVTINIVTSGGLIDKASEAKRLTQAEQINEQNHMNETALGIDEAVAGGKFSYINSAPVLPIADGSTDCIVVFENNDILLASYNSFTQGCPSIIIVINGASITTIGEKITMYAYVEQAFTGTIQGGIPVDNVTLQTGWNKCEATIISETEVGEPVCTTILASELPELIGLGIGTDGSGGTYLATNWTRYIQATASTRAHINPIPVLPIVGESTSCIVSFENNDILLASYNSFTIGCPSVIIVINGAEITTIGEKITMYAYVEQAFTGTIQGGVPVDNVTLQTGWNKVEATIISETEVGEPVCTTILASELPELINLKTAIDGSGGTLEATNWTRYITSI